MKKEIYLAGPITGLSYQEITEWRDHVTKQLADVGITCYSPMRGKEYLSQETSVKDSYNQYIHTTQRTIFARDHYDATKRDLLFVNFLNTKRVSIGTVMEIAWAYQADVPIVLVLGPQNEDGWMNVHHHSMLLEACPFTVPTLEDGIDITKQILLP